MYKYLFLLVSAGLINCTLQPQTFEKTSSIKNDSPFHKTYYDSITNSLQATEYCTICDTSNSEYNLTRLYYSNSKLILYQVETKNGTQITYTGYDGSDLNYKFQAGSRIFHEYFAYGIISPGFEGGFRRLLKEKGEVEFGKFINHEVKKAYDIELNTFELSNLETYLKY